MNGWLGSIASGGPRIGGGTLYEVAEYARQNGYEHIRLDGLDTNPRARQLFTLKGFQAVKTERFPYLRWLPGTDRSASMILEVT